MAQPCKIRKPTDPSEHLPEGLVSFGPVYDQNASSTGKRTDRDAASTSNEPQETATEFLAKAKEQAWEHVLKVTPGGSRNTENAYFRAMENIEGTARNAYADQQNGGRKFQETMIVDGCLFLHIAILILGGSGQLGYSPGDPIFDILEQHMERWIKSILYVGNQIPFVVLKELMKQPFFQNVIGKMKLKRPPTLFETALYELLLAGLNNRRHRGICENMFQLLLDLLWYVLEKLGFKKKVCSKSQDSCDLIHSLHILVLGAKVDNNDVVGNIVDDKKLEIPSAKKLSEMGIKIKKERGSLGSARIHFESNWFSTALYLPKFKAGATRKLILETLIAYEKAQQDKKEVCSYVKFMSELVREPIDAKLLHDQGVIDANLRQRKEFPEILEELTKNSKVVSSENIMNVRLKINEHSPHKWPKWLQFIPMGVTLSIVQIIIAILTYRQGQNKCQCIYQNQPPASPH